MDKLMIEVGGNVWIDVASILIVEPRTVDNDRVHRIPGSTAYLTTPTGVETVDASIEPDAVIERLVRAANL
jgi:hypothetical protein